MRPRVVVIGTGGTIASRFDPALGRVVASQSGADLIAAVPGLDAIADVEVDEFATVPSFDMTPAFALRLARHVNEVLARPDVSGAVVTHGTDTMEETCFLADLLLASDKPVVFTGAQRASDEPQSDGPLNLADAVRAAASASARGLGALLCFNGRLHAARDVTKTHASAVETFQSPGRGPLGIVDRGMVLIDRCSTRPRPRLSVDRLEERVEMVRLTLGSGPRLVELLVGDGARGIVVEAFGRGNGPAALCPVVRRAVDAGVPVVVTSRCLEGRVHPIYGRGGGRDLEDAGAIFAGDLDGPKARILLMVLLARPDMTPPRVAEFLADFVGDAAGRRAGGEGERVDRER